LKADELRSSVHFRHSLSPHGKEDSIVPGKFVIRRSRTGTFRFVLVSPNGKVIATSELYTSKAACRNGIRAVQRTAAEADVEDESTAKPSGLKDAVAAAGKGAAKKAKAVVERTAKKLPAPPPPVKGAAKKAKAVVERTAKKLPAPPPPVKGAANKPTPAPQKEEGAGEGSVRKANEVGRRPTPRSPKSP
jgi:uncharacterized protein